MTATQLAEQDAASWHRLSPRMLLIHPIVELGRALPALVGIFIAGTSNGNHYWGLIAAGAVALFALTRWFTTRLRITADQVQLRQGLLRRKTIATTRDRIRTVDVTAHVLHRVLGLAKVVIGTGMNDRKGGGRLIVDGLPAATAFALRDQLLHRVPPTPGAASSRTGPQAAAEELARLDTRWIGYAPFTLSGVLTGLVIWGFYWRVQGESGVDVRRAGPLRAVTETLREMPTAAAVLVVLAALLLFVAVTSTVGYVLAFWNFRLLRHDGGTLQVTRGLLTTRATSIERRRLDGAAISEPLPLRAVGAARTTAVATGLRVGRGAERGGEVLLPPAPAGAARAVCAEVLDGVDVLTAGLWRHGPAARRRRYVRAMAAGGVLVAAGAAGWADGGPVWSAAAGLALFVCCVPLAIDRYRNLGHSLVSGYLVTRAGSLVRRHVALAGSAVIGWNLRASWFQRRAGLVTLTATTAAGRQGYHVTDVDVDDALVLIGLLTPTLTDQFRSAPAPTSR